MSTSPSYVGIIYISIYVNKVDLPEVFIIEVMLSLT